MKTGLAVVGVAAMVLVVGGARAAENLVRNPSFEKGSVAEWQRDASAGGGKVVSTTAEAYEGLFSLKLTPQPGSCSGGTCQVALFQPLDSGAVVGRRVTLSAWVLSSGGNRGLTVRVTMATSGGTGLCSAAAAGGQSGWVHVRGNCSLPDELYAAQLRLTTTGTSGSVYVDDVSLTTPDPGPAFEVVKRPAVVSPLPADAEIVMLSTRHGEVDGEGIRALEVYAMDGDGGSVTRLTSSGRSHSHVAVSPDRTKLAVGRFVIDLDRDGRYVAMRDPQALWVVDLEAGEEWQLLPSWYWSGIGGVDWTPDGERIVFSMFTGPYARLYTIRPDGSELTLISPDTAWASDVAVSADGTKVVYHRQERNPDGSYESKGRVWVMGIDGSDNRAVSDGGIHQPASQGGWAIGDFDPELSPDGEGVVLAYNNPDSGGWDVVRINLDGTARTTLVSGSPDRWAGIPDWGSRSRILFSLWQGAPAPYQGGAVVGADGGVVTLLEPALVDPTDGGVWVRWIPSLPLPDRPRVRRRLDGAH